VVAPDEQIDVVSVRGGTRRSKSAGFFAVEIDGKARTRVERAGQVDPCHQRDRRLRRAFPPLPAHGHVQTHAAAGIHAEQIPGRVTGSPAHDRAPAPRVGLDGNPRLNAERVAQFRCVFRPSRQTGREAIAFEPRSRDALGQLEVPDQLIGCLAHGIDGRSPFAIIKSPPRQQALVSGERRSVSRQQHAREQGNRNAPFRCFAGRLPRVPQVCRSGLSTWHGFISICVFTQCREACLRRQFSRKLVGRCLRG